MLKSYIRSCRLDLSLTSLILLPPICTLRARDVYLQNIGYQVLYASFFPLLPSPKKTFDVFQNIYWILYWNQISGLVTHQAHHRPPSNPLRIIIIWCLSKYILKSDIRSCNAPGSPPPPSNPLSSYDAFQNIYWNQISGLVTHQAHHRPPPKKNKTKNTHYTASINHH